MSVREPLHVPLELTATRLLDRSSELARDIVAMLLEAMPSLRGDHAAVELLEASVRENVIAVLHVFRHDLDAASVTAPTAAIAYARRMAQRGIPSSDLIRTYRLGETRFIRRVVEELVGVAQPGEVRAATLLDVVERCAAYIDGVVEQIVAVHERARDEWFQHRSIELSTWVQALLARRNVNLATAESKLGDYRLEQHHLGMAVWTDRDVDDETPLAVLFRLSFALAEAAESDAAPLFVPTDERSAWVWLPLGAVASVEHDVLENTLERVDPLARAALGEPAPSLDGFRRTHAQALSARTVALAAKPHGARLTPFSVIAPIAMMCDDLPAVRSWVHETLGPLAIDDERRRVLRETARVFLETNGSYTATAERLVLHRNTAQYRVRKAEEERGRPLDDGRLDVELALLTCHWLGQAVLMRGSSEPPSRQP